MRIRLLLGADPDRHNVPARTLELLEKELSKDDSIVIADENPDIILLVGAWTSSTMRVAKDAMQRYIAFAHIPLGSLAPWYAASSSSGKCTSRCDAVIASGKMEMEFFDDGNDERLYKISNAVVTNTTTAEQMVEEYKSLCQKVVEKNGANLWLTVQKKTEMIKEPDTVILEICKNLFYAECLSQRRNIPQPFLDSLAELLIKSDYDEDRLGEILNLVRLYEFTQRLEFVMQETTTLTEGFMPLEMKEDKTANTMLSYITNY